METKIISNLVDDLIEFIKELTDDTEDFHNLIIDLSNNKKTTQKDIILFLPIAKTFKKNNCSFVIVLPNIDYSKVSDKINVVPSLQEAKDFIEMEAIERDLGI